MITHTDLANYALAHLGESAISTIDDPASKAARVCRKFILPSIDEVLRSHRWNCATKRVALSASASPPVHGYRKAYALPADFVRLLEVNGEQWTGSEEFFEIEDGFLLGDFSAAEIRYIARIEVARFDALLTEAIALKLATKVAVPLTANLNLQGQCAALYDRAVSRARQVDAIETGNRENRPLARILAQSPLLRSRGMAYGPIARFLNRFPRW